jgi:Tol biopolymer transport system component
MTDALYASLKPASNGNWVAVENDDHATCVVDTQSGEGYVLPAHARVSWEPQGTRFAYVAGSQAADSSQETVLYLYDTQTHIAEPFFTAKGLLEAIWSPDGAHIAVYANYAGVPLTYSVLDVHTGEVRYTGPYDTRLGDCLRWSADGARLAVSRNHTETLQFEWDVLDIASGERTRLPMEAVSETSGWQPDDVDRHRTARSHSGRYRARAQLSQRSGESEWWAQPSLVSILDLETGETVREWEICGLVPAVRWSAGDGWLILGVLQVQDVACEHSEFGPCGIYSSVWRLPINSSDESDDLNRPERAIDDGFLVEVVSVH